LALPAAELFEVEGCWQLAEQQIDVAAVVVGNSRSLDPEPSERTDYWIPPPSTLR